jgi:hypothetical protein
MTPQRQKDIKVIACRIEKILKSPEGMPFPSMFWEDLETLTKLILEGEKSE